MEEDQQDNHEAGLVVSLPGALRWLEAGFDGAGEEGVEDDGVGASRGLSRVCFEVSAGLGLGPERSTSPNSSQYFQKEICTPAQKKKKEICTPLKYCLYSLRNAFIYQLS